MSSTDRATTFNFNNSSLIFFTDDDHRTQTGIQEGGLVIGRPVRAGHVLLAVAQAASVSGQGGPREALQAAPAGALLPAVAAALGGLATPAAVALEPALHAGCGRKGILLVYYTSVPN